MDKFLHEIRCILASDPGGRGIGCRASEDDVAALARELRRMERALIVTGFPMKDASGRVCCETDGPAGAADMAFALASAGIQTAAVTDETSLMQVRAAFDCRAPGARVYLLKKDDPAAAERLVRDLAPTHIIAIERPGKAADGHFHTARGAVIDDMLSDTDLMYDLARRHGALSVAIGDGGNELGTGKCRQSVSRLIPGGGVIAAFLDADITLMAGVSNWWGWGVAAIVSAACGRDLLPGDAQEKRLMRALIASGAVDGVTKEPTLTVDALSLETNLDVLRELRGALRSYFIRRPVND